MLKLDNTTTKYLDGAPGAHMPPPAGTPDPAANVTQKAKPAKPITHRAGNGQFKKAPKGK